MKPDNVGTMSEPGDERRRVRRQCFLLGIACVCAATLCVVVTAASATAQQECELRRSRAGQLARDAQAIERLRQEPRRATDAIVGQQALLGCVASAIQSAGLAQSKLASTLPQPPRRLPESDYVGIQHMLVFENVSLRELATFCNDLVTAQPALRVASLALRADRQSDSWNADVGISYWIHQPQ